MWRRISIYIYIYIYRYLLSTLSIVYANIIWSGGNRRRRRWRMKKGQGGGDRPAALHWPGHQNSCGPQCSSAGAAIAAPAMATPALAPLWRVLAPHPCQGQRALWRVRTGSAEWGRMRSCAAGCPARAPLSAPAPGRGWLSGTRQRSPGCLRHRAKRRRSGSGHCSSSSRTGAQAAGYCHCHCHCLWCGGW